MTSANLSNIILQPPDCEKASDKVQKVPSRALGFLDLPGEIRNRIYRMTLTTEWAFKEEPYARRSQSRYELSPAILRANRQIHREARDILYDENLWVFLLVDKDIIGSDLPGVQFLPAISHRRTSSINRPALTVSLRYPYARESSMLQQYILGPEGIPFLIECLWKRNSLSAELENNLPSVWIMFRLGTSLICSKEQLGEKLLKPFSEVWFCARVNGHGFPSGAFRRTLCRSMVSPSDAFTNLIRITSEKLEEGNRLLGRKLADDACCLYSRAFHFFLHQKGLASGTSRDDTDLYIETLVRCLLCMAKGLMTLQLYENAWQILQAIPSDHLLNKEKAIVFFYYGAIKVAVGNICFSNRPHVDVTNPNAEQMMCQDLGYGSGSSIQKERRNSRTAMIYTGPVYIASEIIWGMVLRPIEDGGANYAVGSIRLHKPSYRCNARPVPTGITLPFTQHVYQRRVFYNHMLAAAGYFKKAYEIEQGLDDKSQLLSKEFLSIKQMLDEVDHFCMPRVLVLQCKIWFGKLDQVDLLEMHELVKERRESDSVQCLDGVPLESGILLDTFLDRWVAVLTAKGILPPEIILIE